MKNMILMILTFGLLLVGGQSGFACSCVIEPDQQQVNYQQWAGDFKGTAFSGRVVKIEMIKAQFKNKVTFAVDKYWRGIDNAVAVVYTAKDSGLCGVYYVVGEIYVVIADKFQDKINTDSCSEMTYREHRDDYLKALGEAKTPGKRPDQGAQKIDEFGNVNCEGELARLDAFAVALQNEPGSRGYIVIYGGRTGKRNEAKARAARMVYYLTKRRGINPQSVIAVDGGYRKSLAGELWIARSGESAPKATPTVAAKNVKLKGTAKIRPYGCGDEM